ncbi:MAG TPA: hypothetical protein VF945_12850, partial [Polyangia bacterium]
MRAGCMVAVVMAGCSFNVIGTNVGDPTAGATPPSPTQSVPNGDGGAPAAQTPPSSTGPDMAQQRIGTACTVD